MGKYDSLKKLKKTKARVPHVCSSCGSSIATGEEYYKEHIDVKFLHTLHATKYCHKCHERQDLLIK